MKNCVLFLNGEYWGMYTLMEKFSSDFFSKHYGIPKDNVVYFKQYEMKEGPIKEYNEIMNFMYIQKRIYQIQFFIKIYAIKLILILLLNIMLLIFMLVHMIGQIIIMGCEDIMEVK